MIRSDMVRLICAYCNLHTFRTIDEFSGDYMMTLEEANNLLANIEQQGMLPPTYVSISSYGEPIEKAEWECVDNE